MRRGDPLPPVWLAPGAVSDPAALARFVDLTGVPVPVGPVVVEGAVAAPGPLTAGVGGVEHTDHPGVTVATAADHLAWCHTHDLTACLVVRGRTTGELAEVLTRLRRSVASVGVGAVEVDLRGADEQSALKTMARVREVAPRDQLLLARLCAGDPDLVGVARSAVAGGAGAVVVSGQTRLGEGRWWSGASTLSATLSGLRLLSAAADDRRWPGAPLLASGGVHGRGAARAAREAGAAAVVLGTALWADPSILDQVRAALDDPELDHPVLDHPVLEHADHPDHRPTDAPPASPAPPHTPGAS